MSRALAPDLLRMDGVTCAYGTTPVLVDVDLSFAPGQFTGIVGPSGCGKTTLLRALTGGVRPVAGSIHRRVGLRTAYVPQVETVDWAFPVTASQCVLMARPQGRRLPWPTRAERAEVAEVFARLGLEGMLDRHIRDLSGGQQQRVFLARALIQKAELLLLDEPTSGVDLIVRHDILHLLRELSDEGLSIVLTTHDLNGVATHLPRLVCLNREIVAAGAPLEVLRPAVLERTYGASMDVLQHNGVCVIVDAEPADPVVALEPAS